MKKFSWHDGAALAVWFIPVIYLLNVYSSLPVKVALHFGLNGRPDRYGDRAELLIPVGIVLAVSLKTYFLVKFLPLIDPKQKAKYSSETFQKLALGLVLFLSAINVIIIASANGSLKIDKLLYPLLGLFFAFLGNVMHSIKPNYFAGIRTPWTLESEDTWRATHRMGGKIWFFGGILITILTLLLSGGAAYIVFISCVVIMALVPSVFSYVYFKNHRVKA